MRSNEPHLKGKPGNGSPPFTMIKRSQTEVRCSRKVIRIMLSVWMLVYQKGVIMRVVLEHSVSLACAWFDKFGSARYRRLFPAT